MNKSELVTTQHLANNAIVYIRQSTQHQMLTNQESLRLQYDLKEKAIELGWSNNNIIVIDSDLGLTGSAAEHREGFKELVTQVTLGKVGIILSYDVTRLSRNCSDWYPLLDICGFKNCLIADREGVYDPSTPNGRLLLGLKGQLAEVELNTIRARLTAGLLNKAKRGELALTLPTGFLRSQDGQVQKDPNLEIQTRIQLVFDIFLQKKSASKTLRYFNNNKLLLPRYDSFKDFHWNRPTVSAIISILKNPAYAGAFAYGKTRTIRCGTSSMDKKLKKMPIDEWKVLIKNKYPAYINWEIFEKIQNILKQNYAEYERNKTLGIPRSGTALLHGLIYCGKCGHKMVVQYKKGTRYICNQLKQKYGVPICQFIPADPIDDFVVGEFFKVLSPIELDAYHKALERQTATNQKIDKAHMQQLERLKYQAKLAERQFNQVDPDNRLVAAELEKRWENSLYELKKAEEYIEFKNITTNDHPKIPEEVKIAFEDIGKKLPKIWNKKILSQQEKKEFLRCLIDKVVIHRRKRDIVKTRIVWRGGATTTTEISINVGSFSELSCAEDMENLIIEQVRKTKKTDIEIAKYLTDLGFRSPMKSFVRKQTVQSIRLKHRLLRENHQSHSLHVEGFLTVSQLAKTLGVNRHWIYDRIHKGQIKIKKDSKTKAYLFPNKQKTIKLFNKLMRNNFYSPDFS